MLPRLRIGSSEGESACITVTGDVGQRKHDQAVINFRLRTSIMRNAVFENARREGIKVQGPAGISLDFAARPDHSPPNFDWKEPDGEGRDA
jgi:hypothetical protein